MNSFRSPCRCSAGGARFSFCRKRVSINGIVGAIRERTHRVVLVAILSCIEREYLVLHVLFRRKKFRALQSGQDFLFRCRIHKARRYRLCCNLDCFLSF